MAPFASFLPSQPTQTSVLFVVIISGFTSLDVHSITALDDCKSSSHFYSGPLQVLQQGLLFFLALVKRWHALGWVTLLSSSSWAVYTLINSSDFLYQVDPDSKIHRLPLLYGSRLFVPSCLCLDVSRIFKLNTTDTQWTQLPHRGTPTFQGFFLSSSQLSCCVSKDHHVLFPQDFQNLVS